MTGQRHESAYPQASVLEPGVAADTYRMGWQQQHYHGGKSIWRCVCLQAEIEAVKFVI